MLKLIGKKIFIILRSKNIVSKPMSVITEVPQYQDLLKITILALVLLSLVILLKKNTVDPDQLASDETIRSGSTLFSNLIELWVTG